MGILEKVEGIVTIGILAAVGYIVAVNWDTITGFWCMIPGMCTPPQNCGCSFGQAELCVLSGGTWHECKADGVTPDCTCEDKIVVNPYDEHGCLKASQHWCDTEQKCRDFAQGCIPEGGCTDPCTEWSPMFNKCLFNLSLCPEHIDACVRGTTRCLNNSLDYCVDSLYKGLHWEPSGQYCGSGGVIPTEFIPKTPCSLYNGNDGQYYECFDGQKVCDTRSCIIPPSVDDCVIGETRCVDTYLERCLKGSMGFSFFPTGERCEMVPPVTTNCIQAGNACLWACPSGWHDVTSQFDPCSGGYKCCQA